MKTVARQIMEARNAGYARKPPGMMDETDLLLWQQDVAERLAAQKSKKAKKSKHGATR